MLNGSDNKLADVRWSEEESKLVENERFMMISMSLEQICV